MCQAIPINIQSYGFNAFNLESSESGGNQAIILMKKKSALVWNNGNST